MQIFRFFCVCFFVISLTFAKPNCASFTESDCPSECLVDQINSKYVCRAPENECEEAFTKKRDKDTCQNIKGCHFFYSHCYCSPHVTCFCGGGPPDLCLKEIHPERLNYTA